MPILLLFLLPGTSVYILSGTHHFPSVPACWAKGSNGQREHCLVRSLGRTFFSSIVGTLSVCLPPPGGEDRVHRKGTEGRLGLPRAQRAQPPWQEAKHTRMWRVPALLPTRTGWVTFLGILQIPQNRSSAKGTELNFLHYLGRGGASVLEKELPKGA